MKKTSLAFLILIIWSSLAFGETFEDVLGKNKITTIVRETANEFIKHHPDVKISPAFYNAMTHQISNIKTSLNEEDSKKKIREGLTKFMENYAKYLEEQPRQMDSSSKLPFNQKTLNDYLKVPNLNKMCREIPCKPPCCMNCDPPPCKTK